MHGNGKAIQCTCTLNPHTCADFSNICGVHRMLFAIISTNFVHI